MVLTFLAMIFPYLYGISLTPLSRRSLSVSDRNTKRSPFAIQEGHMRYYDCIALFNLLVESFNDQFDV